MDILSDVNISGFLKTSRPIFLGGLGGPNDGYAVISGNSHEIYTPKLVVDSLSTACSRGATSFGSQVFFKNVVDFSEATITGLPEKSYCLTINVKNATIAITLYNIPLCFRV